MVSFEEYFIAPVFDLKDSNTIAFCIADKIYTYKQLFDYVEQIYCEIESVENNLVGLYATDDIRTYASILALWLMGKTYVPLNPNQPKERHIEVMSSVHSLAILSADINYQTPVTGIKVFYTNEFTHENYVRKDIMKVSEVSDDTLAYIIFTSGSTGKPKGVQLTRGNVAHFIDSMNHIGLDITSADRCLQPFDLTFDFSVSSYVIPLVKGASVYTVPNKAVKFTYIAGLLEEYNLTVLQMVPSMIRNLLPYLDEVELGSVRYNILCGEALTGKVIVPWHKANPKMVSYNMYGPTEDTVFCTCYLIDESNIATLKVANDIVSIGKTFLHNNLILLDENDHIINTPNVEGELCLCGNQLTPGYWENDKENSEKFLMVEGRRYYRSGDMCFYTEEANLMYVSRKDFQVKINGFRVELGEIENRYSAVSGGKYAVVMPFVNEQGNTELAIVIEGKEYDTTEHKAALASELPNYEVPSRWLFVRSIPLNQNGKVDRKKIKSIFNL